MSCNFFVIQSRHMELKPKGLEWWYLSNNYWKSTPNATNLVVDVSGQWRHQNLKSLYLGQFSSDSDDVFFLNFCFFTFYPLIWSVRLFDSPLKRWKFSMQFVRLKWKIAISLAVLGRIAQTFFSIIIFFNNIFDQNMNKHTKACFHKAKIYPSKTNLVSFIKTTQFYQTEHF